MKLILLCVTISTLTFARSSSLLAMPQQASQQKYQQPAQVDGAKDKQTKPAIPCPLSADQKKAIQLILAKNKIKLAPTALKLAGTVTQVYNNLLDDNMDEQLADRLRQQMKDTMGDLVAIRGEAMREAVKVLTSEQKRYLKKELAKPGAPGELVEALMKVFEVPEN